MNGRKLVLGAVAAAVVGFLLSGLWHVLLLAGYYESASFGTMRDPAMLWVVGIAYLVVGFIMAYMYPKGYEGGSPVSEGLKFGALIGLLWWFPTQLVLYGVFESPFSMVLVDGGWHVVEEGLAGVALAMVYGRSEQTAAVTARPAAAGTGHGGAVTGVGTSPAGGPGSQPGTAPGGSRRAVSSG